MNKETIIILLLTVLLIAPFFNKAYHMDDWVYLYLAKDLVTHPLDPYGGYTWGRGMQFHWIRINHPPLQFMMIGFASIIFRSMAEIPIRITVLVYTLLSSWGFYQLARRFSKNAFITTILFIITPAFIISNLSLTADVPCLAFFLVSLAFYIRGIDKDNMGYLVTGGIFAAAACLSRYPGISLFPLVISYVLLKRYRVKKVFLSFLIPVFCLGIWFWYTEKLYGTMHIMLVCDGLNVLSEWSGYRISRFKATVTVMNYIGSVTIFPVMLILPFLRTWTHRIIFCILGFVYFWGSPFFRSDYTLDSRVMFAFFAGTGTFVFGWIIWRVLHPLFGITLPGDLVTYLERNSDSLFLFLWIAGTLCSILMVYFFTCVRYILLMVPPVILFISEATHEWLEGKSRRIKGCYYFSSVGLGIIFTLILTMSDYEQAGASKIFAADVSRKYQQGEDHTIWLAGDFGMRYYLEAKGFPPFSREKRLHAGDMLIHAETSESVDFKFYLPPNYIKNHLEHLELYSYEGRIPCRLTDTGGFYHSGPGPLAFTFPKRPLIIFGIYRANLDYVYNPNDWIRP